MPEFIVPGEDDFSVFAEDLTPDGCDGSHHGLTDLYPQWRKTLEDAFSQGKLFKARWGSKKELWHGTITRRPEGVTVTAGVHCDEDADLVEDAMWQAFKPDNEKYEKYSQDANLVEQILRECDEYIIVGDYCYEASASLPKDATLDQCLGELSEVLEVADKQCEENFKKLVALVLTITKEVK